MARFDATRRELVATVLLTGPAGAGKRSLVEAIRNRLPEHRRALESPPPPGVLSWLPLDLGRIGGWQVRLQLYVLPERGDGEATRRLLISEADGLLAVLDSQASRLDDNLAALRRMQEAMLDREGDIRDMPTVFLYTKQDLPRELILPLEELDDALNFRGAISRSAIIPTGSGVLEALHAIVTLVLRRLAPAAADRPVE
jgi:signal recognition particle receptor subunit beta